MGVKLPQYPPERKPSHGTPVPPPPPPMNQNSRIAKELIKKIYSGEPCIPKHDVRHVLESLGEIEAAICGQPCSHEECDCGYCTHPLKLLRELQADLEAIPRTR